MAFRDADLKPIGGFAAIREYLADDYQLGARIAARGKHVALSGTVVETNLGAGTWSDVWKHQVRWSRTIRVSRPAGYFGYLVTQATFWSIIAALCGYWRIALACMAVRLIAAVAAMGALGELRARSYRWFHCGICSGWRSGQLGWQAAKWSGAAFATGYVPTDESRNFNRCRYGQWDTRRSSEQFLHLRNEVMLAQAPASIRAAVEKIPVTGFALRAIENHLLVDAAVLELILIIGTHSAAQHVGLAEIVVFAELGGGLEIDLQDATPQIDLEKIQAFIVKVLFGE